MWVCKIVVNLLILILLSLSVEVSLAQRGGSIQRGRQKLPQGRQTFQRIEKKKLLQYVKPSKQSQIYFDKGTDEAELEKVTLLEIQQLYRILQTSNRPDIQVRLASLYVEQARIIENRLYEKNNIEMEKYRKNEIKNLPQLNLSPVKDYSRKAIRLFESYLARYPKGKLVHEVLFHLAYSYSQMGRFPEMLQSYQRLVRSYPKSSYVEPAYFQLGEYYFDQRKWKQARYNYDRSSRFRGKFYSFSIYKIGWSLYNEGKSTLAIKFMERVIQDARTGKSQGADFSKEALNDLVSFYAYSDVHRASDTLAYFNKLVSDEDQIFEIFEKIGFIYKDIGKIKSMRYIFNTLISWKPHYPRAYDYKYQIVQAYSYAGQSSLFNKEFEEWIRDYSSKSSWNRANRSDSDLIKKVNSLLEVSVRNFAFRNHHSYNKTKKASDKNQAFFGYNLYFKYFDHTDKYPDMVFHHGEFLFDLKQYQTAAGQYEIIIDKYPKHSTYPVALLNRVLALEQTLPSETDVRKLVQGRKEVKLPQNILDFREAVLSYIEKFPKKESNVNMVYTLARILYEFKDYPNAIRYWMVIIENDAFKKSKLYVQSVHSVLDTFNLMKDFEGLYKVAQKFAQIQAVQGLPVLKDIQKIIREIEFKRAQDLAQKGNLKKSAQMYELFYQKNSKSKLAITALYNAAINYEKMNQKLESFRIYNKLLKVPDLSKHPQIKDKIFMILPEIYQNQGLYLKAAYAFKEYGVQFPKKKESAEYWYNAALIFDGMNVYDEATRAYLEYHKRTTSSDKNQIYFLIGRMRERQGQFRKAIGNYTVYLQSPDQNKFTQVMAAFRIAELNKQRGNIKEAQTWYRRTLSIHRKNKAGLVFAAKSQFHFAYEVYKAFKKLRIPKTPARQATVVQKKLAFLENLKSEVKKVIEINEGSQVVASLALIGLANKHMGDAILNSTLPKGLSAENLKKYKEGLQQTAQPFLDASQESLSQAEKKSRDFVGYAPWLKEVRKVEGKKFKEIIYNVQVMGGT